MDTNVLMSGVFFGGIPGRVLAAWRDGWITPVLTPSIFDEYRRIGESLTARYGDVGLAPVLDLLLAEGALVLDQPLPNPVSRDADDDKFLAAAVAGIAEILVSGDQDLLSLGRFGEIRILTPRQFLEELPGSVE